MLLSPWEFGFTQLNTTWEHRLNSIDIDYEVCQMTTIGK
jgi:hypothetical protein